MLSTLISIASATTPIEVPVAVQNHAWCFGSGLRVLYEQDTARPEFNIHTVVDGGSGGEDPRARGVAHLVEHLWFHARPTDGAPVKAELAALGASFNAYTQQDVTVFITRGPSRSARALLTLEAARLEGALKGVTLDGFDVERNIVRNELRQNYSDTEGSVLQPLMEGLFPPDHPYNALTIGTELSLQGLTFEHASDYVARWYVPRLTTVSVSGPLDVDRFMDVLTQTFPASLLTDASGEVNGTCQGRGDLLPLPKPTQSEPLEWVAAVDRPLAVVGWVLPPDASTLASFDLFVTQWMMNAKLERPVYCDVEPRRHATIGTCSFGLEAGEDGPKLVRQGLTNAAVAWEPNERQTIADAYRRWQAFQRHALLDSLERAGGENAALHFHDTGAQDWMDARSRALQVEDFSEAALFGQTHLTAKHGQIVIVQPSAQDPSTLQAFHGSRAFETAQAVDPGLVDQAFLARIIAEPDWSAVRRMPMKNGMTLTVLPYGRVGMSRASMVFPGGRIAEPRPLIDRLAWQTMPSVSTAGWDLAREVLGNWDEWRTQSDWRYTLSGAAFDRQLAGLVAHHTTQVPSGETARSIRREDASVATPYGRAAAARGKRLQPGTPQTPEEVKAALAVFSARDLKAYAKDQLRPDGAHLVVLGPVDAEKVAIAARDSLGALKGTGVPRTNPTTESVGALPEPEVLGFDDPIDRAQASVVLECRLDTDPLTAEVVANAVQAVLDAQLRESAGLTYGVYAETRLDDRGHRLHVSTQVQRDAASRAVIALRDGVRTLGQGTGIDQKRLAAAKVEVAVDLADQFQHPEQVLHWLIDRAIANTAATDTIAADLAAVDAAGIRAALGACADHEVVTVVGTGVKAQLQAAGLTTE